MASWVSAEDGADIVEHAGIGGRVGAGRAADGLLVDANDLIHELKTLHPVALARTVAGTVQLTGQRLVQDLVDQAGLAGTGNAGHTDELPQREPDINVAQVVFPGTFHGQKIPIAGAAGLGHGNALAAGKIIAGDAPLGLTDILHGTRRHDLAAVNARAGAHIHDIVRAAHGILVVLDHDDGITEVPQVLQGRNELVVVTLVQADAGLVQHIEHAGQCTADLGGEADALALAAGQSASRAGQASGNPDPRSAKTAGGSGSPS